MVKGAWVTLATNDSYSLGALVLAHSLKQVGTQQELAILVTPGVTNSMRARLSDVFSIVREVNILDSRDKANLRLLQRPELGITFTKLHCWQLTEYDKCVFLDADTLVLQNCDELFEREELSAAPDVGWPDCFNSGVFVYRPSEETYNNLIQFALDKGSFDGGDQGLLNLYFADWARKDISKHLPFIYNVCSTAFYSYLPAFKQFGKDVKIIHFIGNAKPWLQYFDTESQKVRPSRDLGHLEPILQRWWNIFCSLIHPSLSPDMSGLAGAFAKLTLGQQRTPEQEALEDSLRRQNWEQGNIDYLGKDSFDNIWGKICETLARGPQENEGGNSTQIRNDDSVVSTQQEASAPTKEDVLPTYQETRLTSDSSSTSVVQEKSTTDPISSPPLVAASSENTPREVPVVETVPPKGEPSPVENLTISPENISESKTEETPESKNISTPTEQTQSDNLPTPEDTSVSVVSSEILSEKLPGVGEILESGSVPIEKEPSNTSKPETVLVPTPASVSQSVSVGVEQTSQENIPSSPVAKVPSPEILKQDIPIEKALPATQLVSSTQQAPPTEQLVSPPLPVCPLKDVPPVERTPTSEAIPSSNAALTSQVVEQEIDAFPKIDSAGQSNISEQSSCALAKTATPTNISKHEKVPSEKISQPLDLPEEKTTPPPTESRPVKEEPSKPEQTSAEKISQPLSPTEEKITSSPTSTTPIKEAISQPAQIPSDKIPQPSSPLQEKVPLTSTQVAPSLPEGTSTPVTALQQISAPATTTLPSTVAATSPVVSSDIQPPVTAPPRKGGANKKQNKSKK